MRSKIFIIYLVLLSMPIALFAQTKQITGTVIDETKTPLPGVNILLKNKNTGTITDIEGNFSIQCSSKDTIQISYVGYEDEFYHAGSHSTLNIQLKPTAVKLGDVVVVGYGTQKKESVVGAIAQVTGEELQRVKGNSSLVNTLSGLMPGLTTLQTTGMPGGGSIDDETLGGGAATQFLIRGKTTWNGSGAPLVLVDGVEREIADINPEDVETISVLKDASATAVFGVKGGNGVIMITTKRGKLGKPILTFSTSLKTSQPSKIPKTVRSYEARRYKNEAIEYELPLSESAWSSYTPEQELNYFRDQTYPKYFPDVYWPDYLIEKGLTKKANIGISGGTNFVKYYGSLSFLDEDDIIKGEDYGAGYVPGFYYKRYNYRSNIDFSLTKSTELSINIGGYYGRQTQPGGNKWNGFWQGLYTMPSDLYPVQYEDGLWGHNPEWAVDYKNPVMALNTNGLKSVNRSEVTSDFRLKQNLDFITKGLTVTANFAFDNASNTYGPSISHGGSASKYVVPKDFLNLLPGQSVDSIATYSYPSGFTEATHGFDYVPDPVTYSGERGRIGWSNNWTKKFNRHLQYKISFNYDREFGKHTVGALGVFMRDQKSVGSNWPSYREDWVGRMTYNYDTRYFLEFNSAYNGSEKFSEDYRFGFFPSIAFGYTISNEPFFKKNLPIINLLKFRYSDGRTGSDVGPNKWEYVRAYDLTSSHTSFIGGGYLYMNGFNAITLEGKIPNADAHWETAHKQNLGIEFGILQNLFSFNLDLFKEYRSDMYIVSDDRTVPSYTGGNAPGANLGIVNSKGYELEVDFSKAFSNSLHIWLGGTYTYANDEVIYKEDAELMPSYQKEEGYAIDQPRSILNAGIAQDWDDIYTNIVHEENINNWLPGSFYQIDYNADGVINSLDRTPYNYPGRPINTYSFSGGFEFKGFSLMTQFYGVRKVSRGIAVLPFDNEHYLSSIRPTNIENSWMPSYGVTDKATYAAPRLDTDKASYDFGNVWSVDASFLRLKNVQIAYTFNQAFITKLGMSKLKVYVSGTNLYIWTDMIEDREAGNWNAVNYPITKDIIFGIDLTF